MKTEQEIRERLEEIDSIEEEDDQDLRQDFRSLKVEEETLEWVLGESL